jgi:hypothetical protein
MNKFKNKWIFIIAILVIILGIFIYSNKDDIIKLVGINNKNVYDSNTDQSYWASDVCYKKDPFINAYEYNDSVSEGEKGYCISGKEDTCLESKCYKDKSVGSCSAGTIIHYFVNETEDYYFNVLHDDGDTMTLQSLDAITQSAWSGTRSYEDGPNLALNKIESVTLKWKFVNDLNYTLGKGGTIFLKNPNNSNNATDYICFSSLSNGNYCYSTIIKNNVKARIITVQEAADVGCTESGSSCPQWMYNSSYYYLTTGGSNKISYQYFMWYVSSTGQITSSTNTSSGPFTFENAYIRAVIEISKD